MYIHIEYVCFMLGKRKLPKWMIEPNINKDELEQEEEPEQEEENEPEEEDISDSYCMCKEQCIHAFSKLEKSCICCTSTCICHKDDRFWTFGA
jgi:hypothetical protein